MASINVARDIIHASGGDPKRAKEAAAIIEVEIGRHSAGEWRPMKSAPKYPLDAFGYGPEIIVWTRDQVRERLGVAFWDRDFNKWYVEFPEGGEQPTRWMPMPEGPKVD